MERLGARDLPSVMWLLRELILMTLVAMAFSRECSRRHGAPRRRSMRRAGDSFQSYFAYRLICRAYESTSGRAAPVAPVHRAGRRAALRPGRRPPAHDAA